MADILYLVERLEQVLANGWRLPFTTNAVIDEDAFIDIIEQMHIAIPNEIRQAQKIVQQKERLLAQAREEADRLVALAQADAEQMVMQTEVVAKAQDRAAQIIAHAEEEAEDVRAGADEYATEVLTRIREELTVYLRQVDNGLERLQPDEPEAAPAAEIAFEDDEFGDGELPDGFFDEDVPAPADADWTGENGTD